MAIQICATPASRQLNNTLLTASLSHTLISGNNRMVIVFWSERNAVGPYNATFNGVAMTQLFSQTNVGGVSYLNCFYLPEASLPAGGAAYNVAISAASVRAYGALAVISVSGVKQEIISSSSYSTGNGNTQGTRTFTTINAALMILAGQTNTYDASWSPDQADGVEWFDVACLAAPVSTNGGVYRFAPASGSNTIGTTCTTSGFVIAGGLVLNPIETLGQPIFYE